MVIITVTLFSSLDHRLTSIPPSLLFQVDTDTYTTSAAFLLRLLVDEHYVCLVAVAKPLPEPPSLPTRFTPRPPPPSLDMPASRSPFLLAGRTTNGTADLASRRLAAENRSSLSPAVNASSPLAIVAGRAIPSAHDGGSFLHDAPAPRSFGAGPASENTGSASTELSDEEERQRQESLFEAAKAATFVTGDTSPPPADDVDDNMSDVRMDVVPEEEQHDTAVSETDEAPAVNSPRTLVSLKHASASRRTSSNATTARPSSTILAGPTFDVAPPRAIRVMGAPPSGGMPVESETILGVASARIKVVQRAADDGWGFGGLSSGTRDSSWPGLDPKGERSVVTREAHIMTLSVLPGERGQGVGARLLDLLLEECKRRTAGPRIHLAAGSNTFDEGGSASASGTSAPPRAHEGAPMRTVLEMHASNGSAMQLYSSRNFRQIVGSKGVVRHFFRGDQRIPSSVRLKVGGSDAIRMERVDVPGSGNSP